ncbi:hypothetical protein DES53_11478 [Roseimicrobium gellanilyticum]|uniref:Uncharacterized protein n=1 Tax=Roseimicrobium gellanilyticum TaxID=748857 RepID=A0A366H7Q6_9BACT|nr:hypothetical protein [Roseimicrobium gellanilyticum]RBP37340.1 hypothetical protein DES53_11478 [Roseimicrobium gellanilyticum]
MRVSAITSLFSLAGMLVGSTLPLCAQNTSTAPAAATTAAPSPAPVNPSVTADKAAKDGLVWGALIYGTAKSPEGRSEAASPTDFPDLQKRLGKAFPFKHFEILGQHSQVVFREYESWVVPSKDVFLKLDSKGTSMDGGLNLHLQFWQGQQVLVKTDTVLRKGSPLFIGGPKWRDGQVIFVLLLKDAEVTSTAALQKR